MKNIVSLVIILFTLSVIAQEKNLPSEFDYGKTEEGVYTNDYFDLKVAFDPSWIVQNNEQMNQLVESGKELISGDDSTMKSVVDAAMVNTAYLFTVFKHEVGAAVEFNPSIMVIAENTKNFPGIKNGGDYLFHTKNLLDQSQMDYYFDKEISEKEISDTNFHVLEAKLDHLGSTIIQEYHTTVTNGFSLSIVVSYTNDEMRDELYALLDKIEI